MKRTIIRTSTPNYLLIQRDSRSASQGRCGVCAWLPSRLREKWCPRLNNRLIISRQIDDMYRHLSIIRTIIPNYRLFGGVALEYITREVETTVDHLLTQGKVVLVTGARQVGKTTMLKEHLGDRFRYVTLDNPIALRQAKSDAVLFFRVNSMPVIIDEIQRAPELFDTVKWLVDESSDKGQMVLTGSQSYHLMQGVSESLSGRVRIIEMSGLSLRELSHDVSTPHAFVPSTINIWSHIQRGSMPELADPSIDPDAFYTDYVRTYLERDVRELISVRDETRFYNFMVACAARSSQLVNASDIAETVGIDQKTVRSWLSVLQASGVVRLLQPIWTNVDKRLVKAPKLFFMDTGLACHLTRWTSAEVLSVGAYAGHAYETFVVSEVLKSFANAGANLRDVWFYRDASRREIDLVIQNGRTLHPIEIKSKALVDRKDMRHFQALETVSDYEIGCGAIICQTEEPYMVSDNVIALSPWAI